MIAQRLKESLGMMMIGDGVLAALDPVGHLALWRRGPAWWRAMVDPLLDRPGLTRCAGIAEALAGIWLSSAQMPRVRSA